MTKLKNLQCALEDLQTFENPKINLEQYTTTPHIAACILHTAQNVYGDIKGKTIADLGCGSGVLCIGAALLDAEYCAGYIYYNAILFALLTMFKTILFVTRF